MISIQARFVPLLLVLPMACVAQEQRTNVWHGPGSLMMRTDSKRWSSPEALVRDLLSEEPTTRANGMSRLGLDEPFTAVDGKGSPAKPESVLLSYVGDRENPQQAIVAVMVPGAMMFAGFAVRENAAWRRIAAFNCWCKYDLDATAADPLSQFAHFDGEELVLRASGGGTGIYEQEEVHFRFINGRLRELIRFVSRRRECDPTDPQQACTLIRRWFVEKTSAASATTASLVTATTKVSAKSLPDEAWQIRELWSIETAQLSCREYLWNNKNGRYVPHGPAVACK